MIYRLVANPTDRSYLKKYFSTYKDWILLRYLPD